MGYSPWEKVEGGKAPGTVKGRLPLQNAASSFAYQKELIVQVFLQGSGSESLVRDLRGKWQVRIRSDGERNDKGVYISPILFEQTVTWTARVYALNLGGFALVTWQPLGDGGSGKHETTVVESQVCPSIADINAASETELEAYRKMGAWRFLALSRLKAEATARQKYDVEKGFTDFTPEGAATLGGYHFFATWQSAYYKCFIPPGAILETVYDNWQTGQLTTEAFYSFSSQEISSAGALFDTRTGSHWRIFSDVGETGSRGRTVRSMVWRSRQLRSVLSAGQVDFDGSSNEENANGIVEADSRLQGLQLAKIDGGILVALGATGGAASMLRVFISNDEGEHWKRIMNQPLDFVPLASCLTSKGAKMAIYGVNAAGRAMYALLSFGKVKGEDGKETNGWSVSAAGEVAKGKDVNELPTKAVGSLTEGDGGTLHLAARDPSGIGAMILLLSRNGGETYEAQELT